MINQDFTDQTTTAQLGETVANLNLARNEFFTVFPTASESDWQGWKRLSMNVEEVERLIGLSGLDIETRERIGQHVADAKKFLRFQDDYTILMVGSSRAGKSTLINALQTRDLVVVEPGASVTGTVITVSPISKQGNDGQEKACIYYHTWESLVKLVTISGVTPIYTGPIPTPEKLDISRTLTQLEKVYKGINNEVTAKVPESAILSLKDTIEIFRTFVRRNETPSEPNIPKRTILLDEAGLQELREICNENSPLNKNEQTKVIPLIDRVEYRVYFSDGDQNRLAPAILMDVPGAGALTPRHYRRLIEQIKSPKTRAFILVTTQNAIAVGIHDFLSQIRQVLIGGLSDEDDQLRAARRLLIVVNKADEIKPQPGAKQKNEEAIKDVAERIHPEFYQKYGQTNVFRETKAQAALIAHLMQKYPQEGHEWLKEHDPAKGEEVLFQKKYPIFGKFNPSYYRRAIDLAKTSLNADDREERILSWSEVPDLSQRLNEFLGANRLTQDYEQARNYYREAVQEIDRALLAKLEGILPPDQINEALPDPIRFIEKRVGNEKQEDRQQITKDKERITLAFKKACANVDENKYDFVDAIAREFALVLREANNLIEQEITSPEFYQIHFGISWDNLQPYRNNGNGQALKELRDRIEDHLDQQSHRIAARVWTKFQDSLNAHQVEQVFEKACYQQEYTEELQEDRFKRNILGQLKNDYLVACNVAILARSMSYDPVVRIRTVWPTFGSSQPILANEAATDLVDSSVEEKIDYVRTHFTEVHEKLAQELPKPLYLLFNRRMLKDESKMTKLADSLYLLHLEHLLGNDEQKKEALIRALRDKRDKKTSQLLEWKTTWEQYARFREG